MSWNGIRLRADLSHIGAWPSLALGKGGGGTGGDVPPIDGRGCTSELCTGAPDSAADKGGDSKLLSPSLSVQAPSSSSLSILPPSSPSLSIQVPLVGSFVGKNCTQLPGSEGDQGDYAASPAMGSIGFAGVGAVQGRTRRRYWRNNFRLRVQLDGNVLEIRWAPWIPPETCLLPGRSRVALMIFTWPLLGIRN